MSGPCADSSCNLRSIVYCYECKKNYCRAHFEKHTVELKVLTEQLIATTDRLTDCRSRDLFLKFKDDIEQVRREAHRLVDEFYDRRTKTLEDQMRSPGRKLVYLEQKGKRLEGKAQVTHQELDELQRELIEAQKEVEEIRQMRQVGRINISQVKFSDSSPSNIEDNSRSKMETVTRNFITAEPMTFNKIPIERQIEENQTLRFPTPSHVLNCSNRTGVAMANNLESVFIYDNDELKLFDVNFNLIKSIHWNSGTIYELVWMKKLNRFLVVTDLGILFLLDPSNLNSIEQIRTIPEGNWWSAASVDRFLFISTFGRASFLTQFDSLADFQMIKQYRPPYLCQLDEIIQQVRGTDQRLLLVILNPNKNSVRCDVRSSSTFQVIWSRPLTSETRNILSSIRCCLLAFEQYLIIYENQHELIHLDSNGKMTSINYQRPVWNCLMIEGQKLIMRTEKQIFVHPL